MRGNEEHEQNEAEKWRLECEKVAASQWMIDSTNEQIGKLRDLLNLSKVKNSVCIV